MKMRCLLLVSVLLAYTGISMEDSTGEQNSVRQSASLSEGEQQYILQRKHFAVEAFNKMGFKCSEEEVPHIAMLGSGGGQRAAVSLMGSLLQLSQDGLLDTVLYLAGVSGSTWTMAHLYSDPEWSSHVDTYRDALFTTHTKRDKVQAWLNNITQREDFSLSDAWGALMAADITQQWDARRLSEEAERNATNPYPVYGAMEKFCFNNGSLEGQWFELSPHESGFPELDRFVETSLLGSTFSEGVLVEQKTEMDMIQLQGILGSAMANVVDEDSIPTALKWGVWIKPVRNYLLSYSNIMKLLNTAKEQVADEETLGYIDDIKQALRAKVSDDKAELLQTLNDEEKTQHCQKWTTELQDSIRDPNDTAQVLSAVKSNVFSLVRKLAPLIKNWEWGTVTSFLYQYQEELIPECLTSKENFHLMDAGPLVNVPYPSFLGQKRDIDLIIAPESSGGEMFQALTAARDYAAKVQKHFPALDDQVLLEEKNWPRGCYVFEGNTTTPTIVFMPLFNRNNCKDADEWASRMDEFKTVQWSYSNDKTQDLLDTAQGNIKNCKDVLVEEINKAVQRRREKISTNHQ